MRLSKGYIKERFDGFYTAEEWVQIIQDWEQSGMSINLYCEQKKIVVATFYNWRYKLNPSLYVDRDPINDRKLSDLEKRKIIEDWEKSGLTINQYCLRKELGAEALAKWIKKFNITVPKNLSSKKEKGKYKNTEEWLKIIEDWEKSGLLRGTYCRKNKLDRTQFYKYEKRLKPE